jgi:folate-binding protein YgfZ
MSVTVHRTTRDLLTVSGPEAITWLQGQLSQDVAGLAVGEASWAFVLAPQGKVDGWGRVHRVADDAVAIDVDPGAGEAWTTRLNRFKLRTKADLDLVADAPMLAVRGARPDGSLPAGWPGIEGGDLVGDAATDEALDALLAEGAVEVDAAGIEAGRIRSGVPRWGSEIDDETIPATLGQWVIDASVSFTKGCYTGQELVARIDSRGGNVPRRLVVVSGAAPMAVGDEVVVADDAVATITSAAPDGERWVGLAFAKRSVEVPASGSIGGAAVELAPSPIG